MVWAAGGRPVAIACSTVQVAGMVRIGPVYTPPERRGRGYASAATAALSRRVLEAGAEEVLLHTDLANPVSNSIYQRIGYRSVEDRIALAFSADQLPIGNLAFPRLGGILEGIMLLAGTLFRDIPRPLPLLPDTARHRRTGLVPA
jgi:FR47-like protein